MLNKMVNQMDSSRRHEGPDFILTTKGQLRLMAAQIDKFRELRPELQAILDDESISEDTAVQVMR